MFEFESHHPKIFEIFSGHSPHGTMASHGRGRHGPVRDVGFQMECLGDLTGGDFYQVVI